ncbi:hypothetical protein OJAV_G00072540 [Oryzias javanicus]|uniref:Uncharacterized protein n=1 Tax=Oryzias javanicus TaxID=123683 RepID=A0A3S2N187_ORYJA|nr:hypothetical protein OJAV_G00072540 [Oryzias javanicus]
MSEFTEEVLTGFWLQARLMTEADPYRFTKKETEASHQTATDAGVRRVGVLTRRVGDLPVVCSSQEESRTLNVGTMAGESESAPSPQFEGAVLQQVCLEVGCDSSCRAPPTNPWLSSLTSSPSRNRKDVMVIIRRIVEFFRPGDHTSGLHVLSFISTVITSA